MTLTPLSPHGRKFKDLYKKINKDIKTPDVFYLKYGFGKVEGTDITSLLCNEKELAIIVNPLLPNLIRKSGEYSTKIERFINTYEGPILFGVNELMIPITLDWLKRVSTKPNRVFYETNAMPMFPKRPSYEFFVKTISDTFNPKYITLFGGVLELDRNDNIKDTSCVGFTKEILSPYFDVSINKEMCYIGKDQRFKPRFFFSFSK